jgi:hypothetical protein
MVRDDYLAFITASVDNTFPVITDHFPSVHRTFTSVVLSNGTTTLILTSLFNVFINIKGAPG